MGTFYSNREFHTFQNGLCFQISFEFSQSSTGNSNTGCSIPLLKERDELKIVDPLLGVISFSRPVNLIRPNESNAPLTPRLIDFKASSEVADTVINRGLITLSWKTVNTDYVALSDKCFLTPKGPGVLISEDNIQRGCENNPMNLYSDVRPNHSLNSSAAVLLGNSLQAKPISIAVMLTPFFHGTPQTETSRSLMRQEWARTEITSKDRR